ncbi:MAG: Mu-like prophage I protein [Betaproteobacteria bacterium ADurb.Bin341]|nr:MAG: Mu-like prophage I protein [Betaproteobacteria bacterium ADurb.Bin341]
MENNTFILATDGWVQVTPCGEFPHVGAGVTQVIDREACDRIAADFVGRKSDSNYPGVLVDFDHFSLDTEKSSEAAGWISDLEARDTGLWARVRWSDAGLSAVQGGRFRLMSPVFPPPSHCEDLGGGKIRPVMLVSVALTNEPNIKGGRPLANRQVIGNGEEVIGGDVRQPANVANDANGMIENRGGARKYRWVLGNPPSGRHCDVCLARAGQVKTAPEWAAMGMPPCNCHCSLEEVDDETANRWSNVARAASLAVRQAKAAQRKAQEKLRQQPSAAEGSFKAAARASVLQELAEKRSTFNAQRPTLK